MSRAVHAKPRRAGISVLSRASLVLTAICAFAFLPAVQGEEDAPALTELQKRVQQAVVPAVQKGVIYLKASQNPTGNWGPGPHPVGYAALPGLAMLEAGLPAEDASVQQAAVFIRNAAGQLDATYELALAILFLNRLDDAKDVPIIRSFALRLIAGQSTYGGWSYRCPILTAKEEDSLLNFLQKNPPQFNPLTTVVAHPFLVPLPKSLQTLVDPQVKKERDSGVDLTTKPAPLFDLLPNLIQKDPKPTPSPGVDPIKKDKDSSNNPSPKSSSSSSTPSTTPPADPKSAKPPSGTFIPFREYSAPKDANSPAVAQKGKDKDDAKKGKKDKDTKKPAEPDVGQWPSVTKFIQSLRPGTAIAALQQKDDNSNTQFAILGLWAARKHDIPMALTLVRLDRRFRKSQHADGAWPYHLSNMSNLFPGGGIKEAKMKGKFDMGTPPMTCVGLLGLGIGHGAFTEAVLSQKKNPTPPEFVYDPSIQKGLTYLGRAIGPKGNYGGNLYFLWSLERVCVMYHLPTLGGVDWHTWGAQQLLPRQNVNGSWFVGGYPGSTDVADTCMAILFLSRANLNRDLSESLRRYVVVVDPARVNP